MKGSVILAVVFSAVTASAQNYAIHWYTIDAGGGEASGGQYTVQATIGQPDAGTMSGSGYILAGGFWHAIETEVAPPPLLRIIRMGSNAVIAWPNPSTGFELQESAMLPGMWSNVSQGPTVVGDEKQVTVSATIGGRFYRLQKP
jgi:hypothetical protein